MYAPARLPAALPRAATADPATLAAAAKAAAEQRVQRSTAGTPYSAPGGRWSNFKRYSAFQVRCVCVETVWGGSVGRGGGRPVRGPHLSVHLCGALDSSRCTAPPLPHPA